MRNEHGNITLVLLLLIVAVITVGTLMTLLTQEVIATKDFNTVMDTKYATESVADKVAFEVVKTVENQSFDAVSWDSRENYILSSSDVQNIVSSATSSSFMSPLEVNAEQVKVNTDLFTGDCASPLYKIYDTSEVISICAKIRVTVDNSSITSTIKLNNIHLRLVNATYHPVSGALTSGQYVVSSRDKLEVVSLED